MTAVRLTSPDRVLWPHPAFTKADLWRYYEQVAERVLPHLAARPLTVKRFPSGIDGEGFFQKNLPDYAPAHLDRYETWTETSQRTVAYAVVGDLDDLLWLANQSSIELHPWFSRTDRPDRPDLLVFDLDPAGAWATVTRAAHWLREVLDELSIQSVPKTSGKRGLHLYVPVERRYSFSELRGFALAVSRATADRHPDDLTVEMRKAARDGRLLLDWSRPGPAQTGVAPWSPRAHPAGTVSMPLSWDEVTERLDPTAFTLATAPRRPDAWSEMPRPQRIEQARHILADAGYDATDRSPRARTG